MPVPFKKHRAKTGGRKKGTENKRTVEARNRAEYILSYIDKNTLDKDLRTATSSTRLSLYSDMLEYVMPKKARITEDGESVSEISVTIKRTRK